MGIQVNEVTGTWKSAGPADASDVTYEQVTSRVHRVRWGVPVSPGSVQSSLSFTGGMPPIRSLNVGDQFRLGQIRFDDQAVAAGVGENLLQTVVLQLDFTFSDATTASADVTFVLTSGSPTSYFSVSGGFPQTITVGDYSIELVAFQTTSVSLQNQIASTSRSINTFWLYAELTDDGTSETVCTDENRVFTPSRCEIECVIPIDDIPVIADCTVPESPEPIVDCQDIDLPAVASRANVSLTRAIIVDGGGGGLGICEPEFTFESSFICVERYDQVSVDLTIESTDPCNYNLVFTFYLYCPEFTSGCCWWVWCPCDTSNWEAPSADLGCPKTYTCPVPTPGGQWTLVENKSDAGCGDTDPPCSVGNFYGEAQIVCDCPGLNSSSSDSSSSAGSTDPFCACQDSTFCGTFRATLTGTANLGPVECTDCANYATPFNISGAGTSCGIDANCYWVAGTGQCSHYVTLTFEPDGGGSTGTTGTMALTIYDDSTGCNQLVRYEYTDTPLDCAPASDVTLTKVFDSGTECDWPATCTIDCEPL